MKKKAVKVNMRNRDMKTSNLLSDADLSNRPVICVRIGTATLSPSRDSAADTFASAPRNGSARSASRLANLPRRITCRWS